jgi:hypothetical protein
VAQRSNSNRNGVFFAVQTFSRPYQPLTPAPLPILSTGIDWITTTTKDEHRARFVRTLAELWLCKQQEAGHERLDFAWNGYIGWRSEGISYGDRGDGTLVRLSGDQARLHGSVLAGRCDHISRIDFQVTLQDPNEAHDWAESASDEASQNTRVSSGQTECNLISSNRTRSTLYLGRRISERFFRIYNKYEESKHAWPEGSWRYEVEYKGNRAVHFRDLLRRGDFTSEHARDTVVRAFQDYGITVPAAPLPRLWSDKAPRRPTTDEGRLRYLGVCVRPMVAKLTEAYGRDTILDLLQLGDNKEDNPVQLTTPAEWPTTIGQPSTLPDIPRERSET